MDPFFFRTINGVRLPLVLALIFGLVPGPMLCLGATTLSAAEGAVRAPGDPVFEKPDPDAVSFSERVMALPAAGLQMRVPEGGEAFLETQNSEPTAGVRLPDGLGTVLMRARAVRTPGMSVLEIENYLLDRLIPGSLDGARVDRVMRFETPEAEGLGRGHGVTISDRPVRPFYVRLKEERRTVGLAVLSLNEDVYAVYELRCRPADFDRARPVFELMLGTATASDLTFRHEVSGPTFDAPDEDLLRFGDERVELESIGMTVAVPEDGSGFVETMGGRETAGVVLPRGMGTVLLQVRETREKDIPVLELEKAVLERTLLRSLSDQRINIDIDLIFETGAGVSLGRSPAIPSAGRVVRPFYVRLKEVESEPMRGFGIVPLSPNEFVFFQLVCGEEPFETSRQMFELVLKSARLTEGGEIDEERGGLIAAGERVMRGLSADDFAGIVEDYPDQFERIYRPAPGGAEADEEEVGYRRVRAWRGSAADVESGEPRERGPSDGYVLRVDGLVLLDDGFGGTSRADSRAVYYLSEDRTTESWRVTMSVRAEGAEEPEVWSEIGFRVGDSMSVQIRNMQRDSSTVRPSIGPEGYISRLEAYLMPQILIAAEAEGEYAFYAYDQSAEINRLRTVTAGEAEDRPGVWRIRTELSGEQWEEASFNRYGRLIRSETSDGLVKRPIEFDRLRRLWISKGLPLE